MSTLVPINRTKAEWWGETATFLRELADRCDAGEITECVIVYNDKTEAAFASYGHFDDRWRILGALEYAKATVHQN